MIRALIELIMENGTISMKSGKRIALIAHDRRKDDLVAWVKFNKGTLLTHHLYATMSTGKLVMRETGLSVQCYKSGPLGGDMQIGAKVAEGDIDLLIFFWDPLSPLPHDPDIKALLRIAVVYNIPIASNRATADFIISSPLMQEVYNRTVLTE